MKFISILIVALLISKPLFAKNIEAIVVYYTSKCEYFIIETKTGYDLLEWYGGHAPSEGDLIIGDDAAYGMKKFIDKKSKSTIKVWIEDFGLTKDEVIEKYAERCN